MISNKKIAIKRMSIKFEKLKKLRGMKLKRHQFYKLFKIKQL